MIERKLSVVICPVCDTTVIGEWPFESIVAVHTHPIRRYLAGQWGYGKWLKQYYKDLSKIKEKENGSI